MWVPYHQQHGYGLQETSERVQGVEVGEGTLQTPPPKHHPAIWQYCALRCSFLCKSSAVTAPGVPTSLGPAHLSAWMRFAVY